MPVLYEKRGHVALITLSRPAARNCWGQDFSDGLIEYFGVAEHDGDVHCVVITGDDSAGAFSAGANLKDPNTHNTGSPAAFLKGLSKKREVSPFDRFSDFPKPIIAAVNGYAIGIGCIITFCCDLIVASERAEWRLPQIGLGIIPAYGGSARLARWVGKGLATRLAMGFPLPGEEAYRIGLAQWLTPHEELIAKAEEVAAYAVAQSERAAAAAAAAAAAHAAAVAEAEAELAAVLDFESESDSGRSGRSGQADVSSPHPHRLTVEVWHRSRIGADIFLGAAALEPGQPQRQRQRQGQRQHKGGARLRFAAGYRALRLEARPEHGGQGLARGVVGVHVSR